jgi:Tfp pilus assembly protein PilV
MRSVAFPLLGTLARRIRAEAGMTIVETMVAAVILTAGVLGVFVMVETADKINETNRGREAATSLAREVLEKARSTTFAQIGSNNWIDSTLTGLEGGSGVTGSVNGTIRTDVTRRDTTYTVATQTCSVDDSKDGLKTSAGGGVNWCADSTGTGLGDAQPEDMKRVGVTTGWTQDGKQYSIYQAATFSSAGSVVGPNLTEFKVTTPGGLEAETAPTITSNPSGGNMVFQATSVGAADMKFTVDGVPATTGVASAGNGTWTLTWNVTNLKDGVYMIGATAVDALGTHGDPRYIQVTLSRGAPAPLTNITGGYNDVYEADVKKRVVELGWDGSPEGSVTGYEVLKGATTVCAASLNLECMDLNAASSGSTTYTIKTLYTDSGGNPASISSPYTVTAPTGGGALPSTWGIVSTKANASATPHCVPLMSADNVRDLVSNYPTSGGTNQTYGTGAALMNCMAPFSTAVNMAAGNVVGRMYFTNTNNKTCANAEARIYIDSTLIAGPLAVNPAIPASTTTPTLRTYTFNMAARTFAAGSQLQWNIQTTSGISACSGVKLNFGSGTYQSTVTFPGLSGGGGGTITRPAAPTGIAGTANADGTTTITWTAPTGTPAAEFYRIYRDGQNYIQRVDTAGDNGTVPIQWVDTNTGGTTHVYRVTAVSSALAESDFAGPLTR